MQTFAHFLRLALPALSIAAFATIRAQEAQGLPKSSQPSITTQNRFQKISAPGLELRIAPDGCAKTLLLPNGSEHFIHLPNFLKYGTGFPNVTGMGGSRGAFFYQEGLLPLQDIQKESDTALIAQSDKAAVRYEFDKSKMTWTLMNKTNSPMQFFMVLDATVNAVKGESEQILKTPATALWSTATWYQDSIRKVRISGGDRIWSCGTLSGTSWLQGQAQIWEATLKPKETRVVTWELSFADQSEASAITALAPPQGNRGTPPSEQIALKPPIDETIRVFSPKDHQVFQRQTRAHGRLYVSGDVKAAFDKVQAQITGQSISGPLPGEWNDLPTDPLTRQFHASIETPSGGWYQVNIRALDKSGNEVEATSVPHVGIGEVFVTCGQSNSTNYGAARTHPQSGMVSTFSGDDWHPADDPQPGTHDSSEWGSAWPAFGDAMYAQYQVPVAIAATGHGGAPVQNWNPEGPAFAWLLNRINQLGPEGFRAVLWHQGESNAKTSTKEYYESLAGTIAASYAEAGWKFPWFVAHASYLDTPSPTVRDAQHQLWTDQLALEGPDTDSILGDNRESVHFNAKGLKAHGEAWRDKVSAYLDQALGD